MIKKNYEKLGKIDDAGDVLLSVELPEIQSTTLMVEVKVKLREDALQLLLNHDLRKDNQHGILNAKIVLF